MACPFRSSYSTKLNPYLGLYIMLFSACIYVLLERKRESMALHLATMSLLFILATTGIVLHSFETIHSLLIKMGIRSYEGHDGWLKRTLE